MCCLVLVSLCSFCGSIVDIQLYSILFRQNEECCFDFPVCVENIMWPKMWVVVKKVLWNAEKKMYSLVFGENVLNISAGFVGFRYHLAPEFLCFAFFLKTYLLVRVGYGSQPLSQACGVVMGVWDPICGGETGRQVGHVIFREPVGSRGSGVGVWG